MTIARTPSLRVRLSAAERAFALFHPSDFPRRLDEPRWWTVREELLPALNAGRIALVATGHAPDGVEVEVEVVEALAASASAQKGWRFTVEARHGRLFLGDPDGGDGEWIDLAPGRWDADVLLIAPARYALRLAPASSTTRSPPLDRLPDLSPEPPLWDQTILRPRAVEEKLARAAAAQDPAQRAFAAHLGRHDAYDLDQTTGELVLSRDGSVVFRARCHVIGSQGDRGGFRWAWANPSIERALSARVATLRSRDDLGWLTMEEIALAPTDVRRLVALATDAMGLDGYYPVPYDRGVLWVGVSLAEASGELLTDSPAQAAS